MSEHTIDDVTVRGVQWGLVAVLLGSLIYGLVTSPLTSWEISQVPLPYTKQMPDSPDDLIDRYLKEGIGGILSGIFDLLWLSMLVGLIGFVLLAVPGALGGAILSNLIHYATTKLPSPVRVGVALPIGALIGGVPGYLFIFLLELFPAPDRALEFLCFLPVWVGAFCGAWMGWRLASGYRWKRPFVEELPYLEALFRGLGWGFVASVLGSLVHGLLCDLFLWPSLFDGIFVFAFLVMPGNVFWGAILGTLLHILAVKTSLLSRNRTLTGVLTGGIPWFLFAIIRVFPSFFDMDMSIIILSLVAITTGAFIGWRLALAYG